MNEHTQAAMNEVVKKYLDGGYDGDPWNYTQLSEVLYSLSIGNLDCKFRDLKVIISVYENAVCCYHILPLTAGEDVRDDVLEYITRANYGLVQGNFEMDCDDGELRFRLILSPEDLLGDDETVCNSMRLMIFLGSRLWSRYGDALATVMFGFTGGKTVSELIVEVEEQ